MRDVTVYGTDYSPGTKRVRDFLRIHGVAYVYRNLDTDPDAVEVVRTWYPGGWLTPIVEVESSGIRLVDPTESELRVALKSAELIEDAA